MRLFVAIDLPENIKKSIGLLCTGLPNAKWVDVRQLHLTLRFIGEVEEKVFTSIKGSLIDISEPAFSLNLRGVGCFPSKRDPRVLWVGIDSNGVLPRLAEKVERTLVERNGIPPDQRKFSPHITIARFRDRHPSGIAEYLEKNGTFHTDAFPVTEFHLYSSTLTRNGAIHVKEASYPLR